MTNKSNRNITAVVVRLSGEQTVRVTTSTKVIHPKYHRMYQKTKTYLVDSGKIKVAVGDEVLICPSRPISKQKSWAIQSIVKKGDTKVETKNEETL